MNKFLCFCFLITSLCIANVVYAFEQIENEKLKFLVTPKDIVDFNNYVLSNQIKKDRDGNLLFEYMTYDEMGAYKTTSLTTKYLLLSKEIYLNSAIYKYQKPNHEKIDFIPCGYENIVCKYYNDTDIEVNKTKNIPKGNIKIPYVNVGNLKVAKEDLKYSPVAESPIKKNYWAGARDACVAQGMRLPSKLELEQIYKNRALYGLDFKKKNYWTSEEISSCFVYSWCFEGITVHSSREVTLSDDTSSEVRKYLRDNHVKFSAADTTYLEIYSERIMKNSENILLRCVR